MKKRFLSIMVTITVFFVSFFGFNVYQKNIKVVSETSKVTVFSLGIQAHAYCNEVIYVGEVLNGKCSGSFDDFLSRCVVHMYSFDCVR